MDLRRPPLPRRRAAIDARIPSDLPLSLDNGLVKPRRVDTLVLVLFEACGRFSWSSVDPAPRLLRSTTVACSVFFSCSTDSQEKLRLCSCKLQIDRRSPSLVFSANETLDGDV